MNSREIAAKLLETFEESGESYGSLSKATGIPKSMIQRYFSGSTERIPIERLELLCKALGLDVTELLGWDKDTRLREKGLVSRTMTPQQAVLFDVTKNLTPAEQKAVMAMIEAMKGTKTD